MVTSWFTTRKAQSVKPAWVQIEARNVSKTRHQNTCYTMYKRCEHKKKEYLKIERAK